MQLEGFRETRPDICGIFGKHDLRRLRFEKYNLPVIWSRHIGHQRDAAGVLHLPQRQRQVCIRLSQPLPCGVGLRSGSRSALRQPVDQFPRGFTRRPRRQQSQPVEPYASTSGQARFARPRTWKRVGIDHQEQRHILCAEASSHLQGNQPAERIACEIIGTVRLHSPDRSEIERGHLCNRFERRLRAVEPSGLDCVDRIVRPDLLSKGRKLDDSSADAMHDEERRAPFARFQKHQRRKHRCRPAFQQIRLLGNRGCVINRGDGKFLAELLFDLQQQSHCQQRIAAQIEEIAVRPDRRRLQIARPDVDKRFYDRLANGTAISGGRCHGTIRVDAYARLGRHDPRRLAVRASPRLSEW